jgi:CheY-like chemotaxis protein
MVGPSESLFDELRGHAGVREHDVQSCAGLVDALRHLRQQSWDVLLTDPDTTIGDSLAVAAEVSLLHPSLRIIALWPAATNQEIIAAMRANVFACFTEPFDRGEIADMIRAALRAQEWRNGIEVVSGLPHWLTLRVDCHLITADRLIRFMFELQQATLPDDEPRRFVELRRTLAYLSGRGPDLPIMFGRPAAGRTVRDFCDFRRHRYRSHRIDSCHLWSHESAGVRRSVCAVDHLTSAHVEISPAFR